MALSYKKILSLAAGLFPAPLLTAAKAASVLNGFVRRPSHGHEAVLLINQIIPLTVIVTVAELLPVEFVNV